MVAAQAVPIASDLDRVEAALRSELDTPAFFVLQDIAGNVIDAGGKRIRPLLTIRTAQSFGGDEDAALRIAVAVELLHSASLLLDDVIDESPLRRHRPSARAVWGNRRAVVGGAYLFSRVFSILAHLNDPALQKRFAGALQRMCEGEAIQHAFRGTLNTTEADYLDIIEKKTASLFQLACESGAHLGRTSGSLQPAGEFGRCLGMAFQIQDDILDYEGSEERLGKPAGQDLVDGVATLPFIFAFDEWGPAQRERNGTLFRQIQLPRETRLALIREVRETGAIQRARSTAMVYLDRAMESLRKFPPCAARLSLERLADELRTRRT